MRIAVLTVSDAGSRGERPDASGDAIVAWATERGSTVEARALVPDRSERIAGQLAAWCDARSRYLLLDLPGQRGDILRSEVRAAGLDRACRRCRR